MIRHVHLGDDLNVIEFRRLHDVAELGGGIDPFRVGVVVGPESRLIAAEPAEIVAVAVRPLGPDVHAQALILGHMEHQSVIPHPGHLPQQILDPGHRPVFPGAVQLHRALGCIRRVGQRAGGDGAAPGGEKTLQQGIQTVEQAVFAGIVHRRAAASHLQTEALVAEILFPAEGNISRLNILLAAPDDGHDLRRRELFCGKLGGCQL